MPRKKPDPVPVPEPVLAPVPAPVPRKRRSRAEMEAARIEKEKEEEAKKRLTEEDKGTKKKVSLNTSQNNSIIPPVVTPSSPPPVPSSPPPVPSPPPRKRRSKAEIEEAKRKESLPPPPVTPVKPPAPPPVTPAPEPRKRRSVGITMELEDSIKQSLRAENKKPSVEKSTVSLFIPKGKSEKFSLELIFENINRTFLEKHKMEFNRILNAFAYNNKANVTDIALLPSSIKIFVDFSLEFDIVDLVGFTSDVVTEAKSLFGNVCVNFSVRRCI